MSPQNRFMEGHRFPDSSRIDAIIKKQYERGAPIPANGDRQAPSAWSFHHVRREVNRIYFWFGQIMAASDVSLVFWLCEPRWHFDYFLVPSPRNDCSQMLARLVRRSSGIRTLIMNSTLMDPIQKLADFLSAQLLNGN